MRRFWRTVLRFGALGTELDAPGCTLVLGTGADRGSGVPELPPSWYLGDWKFSLRSLSSDVGSGVTELWGCRIGPVTTTAALVAIGGLASRGSPTSLALADEESSRVVNSLVIEPGGCESESDSWAARSSELERTMMGALGFMGGICVPTGGTNRGVWVDPE